VTDLAAAVEEFAARTGVRPTPGGRHPGRGTHNALAALGTDRYLEIIAPDPAQPAPPGPRPFGLDRLMAPRLVTWAVKAPDLDARVGRARAAGYDPGPVQAMGRDRPDGVRLDWRLVRAAEPPGDGLVPFLIDWGATPHPAATAASGCTLVSLRGEHPAPETILPLLAAIGVALPISRGSAPALIATLDTPRGGLELR
jgi:hypothetical protein